MGLGNANPRRYGQEQRMKDGCQKKKQPRAWELERRGRSQAPSSKRSDSIRDLMVNLRSAAPGHLGR